MNWFFSLSTWGLTLCLGLLFGLGNLTLILAYGRGGKASVVTPLAGLYSVITIPLAMLFLGERLSGREVGGIILALASTLALSYEKRSNPPLA